MEEPKLVKAIKSKLGEIMQPSKEERDQEFLIKHAALLAEYHKKLVVKELPQKPQYGIYVEDDLPETAQ